MHLAIPLAAVMSLLDSKHYMYIQNTEVNTYSNFSTTTSSCADPDANCLEDDGSA